MRGSCQFVGASGPSSWQPSLPTAQHSVRGHQLSEEKCDGCPKSIHFLLAR
jgi:hypothetical protein